MIDSYYQTVDLINYAPNSVIEAHDNTFSNCTTVDYVALYIAYGEFYSRNNIFQRSNHAQDAYIWLVGNTKGEITDHVFRNFQASLTKSSNSLVGVTSQPGAPLLIRNMTVQNVNTGVVAMVRVDSPISTFTFHDIRFIDSTLGSNVNLISTVQVDKFDI